MKSGSRKRAIGPVTLVLFVAGLLTLWLRSQKSVTTGKGSTLTSQAALVKTTLMLKGYSERMSKWWAAVSDHETATWTSPLYRVANNMFGMKNPLQRQTLSQGPVNAQGKPNPNDNPDKQYASFSTAMRSVEDLDLYMRAKNYPKDFESVDQMISFMRGKGYFTAPENVYLTSVKARL